VCHLVLAFTDVANPLLVVTMLGLAGLCVPCTVRLWRRPSEQAATTMLFLTAVMILAHTAIIPAHNHSSVTTLPPDATAMSTFMMLPLILDLAAAVQLALWLRRHHRSNPPTFAVHLNREATEPS
jgi:cytochrome c biogenesis factor